MDAGFKGFKPLDREDLDKVIEKPKSAQQRWATDAVEAFFEMDEEAVEVTEWPGGKAPSAIAAALKNAVNKAGHDKFIKVYQRQGRVFMGKKAELAKVVTAQPKKKRVHVTVPGSKSAKGVM